MARVSVVFAVVFILTLAFLPDAFAASSKDVLLSCASKNSAGLYTGTQWTLDELKNAPAAKSIEVDGVTVGLKPSVVLGTTYVVISTGGQDDEVVTTWMTSGTSQMDNGIAVTCYFQHDD